MSNLNFKKALTLESDYKSQILKLQKTHKGLNKLSLFIYGNTATLKSMLRRAKKSSPLKLMTYYTVLQDYDKAQKKARGNAV